MRFTLVEAFNCVCGHLWLSGTLKHIFIFRKELKEAQRTNKPCGKCHYYLLISKTFTEATKNSKKKEGRNQQKEELMFANAEEEFFYEVTYYDSITLNVYFALQHSQKGVSPKLEGIGKGSCISLIKSILQASAFVFILNMTPFVFREPLRGRCRSRTTAVGKDS